MRIVLPWPNRNLSPNARCHWAVKAAAKKKARRDACYLAYDAMPAGLRDVRNHFAGDGPIAFQVTFYPPDARHRDDDNMVGSFKAARDGIADALGVNDRRFRPEYRIENPCKPGRIEVSVTPAFIPNHRQETADFDSDGGENMLETKAAPESAPTLNPRPDHSQPIVEVNQWL